MRLKAHSLLMPMTPAEETIAAERAERMHHAMSTVPQAAAQRGALLRHIAENTAGSAAAVAESFGYTVVDVDPLRVRRATADVREHLSRDVIDHAARIYTLRDGLERFIEAVTVSRTASGKVIPASCLYVEQDGVMTTSLVRAFRPADGRDDVIVGHVYAAERVALLWSDSPWWTERLATAGLWFNDNRGGFTPRTVVTVPTVGHFDG